VFLFFQRYFIRGMTVGAVKGMSIVQLRSVRKTLGPVEVVKGIDLDVESGSLLT